MSVKAQTEKKRNWIWPVLFVVALGAVLFVSGLQQPTGLGGVPLIKTPDEYLDTLNKANALFAAELAKEGQPLTAEDSKNLRDAALMFDELNLFNPSRMGPYFAGGRIHLMLGENQVAAERFQQAINNSIEPTTDPSAKVAELKADSQWYLATCYENENDFNSALPPIDEAVKAYPKRGDYRYTRARALIQLKQTLEAKNDLLEALKINPGDQKAASLLHFIDLGAK